MPEVVMFIWMSIWSSYEMVVSVLVATESLTKVSSIQLQISLVKIELRQLKKKLD